MAAADDSLDDSFEADDGGDSEADSHLSEPYLVGFVIVNIVGLRYYTGIISGREMVGLVREPLNPHDPNAIKVLNTRLTQVGHVDRASAAVLAPLIDSRLATVEAIVPKPPGSRNTFRLPCQIHIFARPAAVPTVSAAVVAGGLQLIDVSNHEFGLSEAAVLQERNFKKRGDEKSVDDIFALVGKGDEGRPSPMDPPKEAIVSELFEHQKEGLGWLVRRENSGDLPPFWEERDGGFVNVLTNYRTDERPEPLKGGIFADDMGLGKTLTLLSLIVTNRPSSSAGSLGGEEDGKKSRTGKKIAGSRKRQKLDDSFCGGGVSGSKTTLVVCPPSVFSTWITQLEEHTMPGCLKVYMYHGERTREPEELLGYDIVFTTYNTLSMEFTSPDSPMKQIEWFRVILDEAHLIKNFAAQQTKAVIALKAKRRWVVTGTPIQNSSFDLFSLMAFLNFQPFSIKSYWRSLVQRPLEQGSKNGLTRLQALIASISLRRTKDTQVGLPPKIVETYFVDLSEEERERYEQMELEARNTVREYIDSHTILNNYSAVLHIILRLRQICNDPALCPSDLKSLLPSKTLEDVSQNPELLRKLASMVEDGDDFDCPVCLCPPSKTIITCCAHIFCQPCILKTLKHLNARCPICRHSLSSSDLFMAPNSKPSNDESTTGFSNRPVSSKVSTLLRFLQASKEQNPFTKSVVFSQFRKMLILLEEPLKAAGFTFLRLDGSMNVKKRAEVIKKFGSDHQDGSPTVLLTSIKAAGTGINLTAATRVYVMEPWWNPAVEEQAMDRVHRIGQREEVRVVKLIVRDSIEERIVEMQERKRNLARGAFGRKAAKEQKEMRVEELRTMMRL